MFQIPVFWRFCGGDRLGRLESVKLSVAEYFSGEVLKKNVRCVERGYNEVKVIKWQ